MTHDKCGCTFTPQGEVLTLCPEHKEFIEYSIKEVDSIQEKLTLYLNRFFTYALILGVIILFYILTRDIWGF